MTINEFQASQDKNRARIDSVPGVPVNNSIQSYYNVLNQGKTAKKRFGLAYSLYRFNIKIYNL